jgi:hypothetical protein
MSPTGAGRAADRRADPRGSRTMSCSCSCACWTPTPAADRRRRTAAPGGSRRACLDPITRPALEVARRADRHLDALRPGPPHQPITGRGRLIDRSQRPPQLAHHVEHSHRPADNAASDHLPADVVKRPPRRSRAREHPARPNAYRSAWSAPSMCGRGRGPNPRPVELRAMRGASTISSRSPRPTPP